MARAVSDSRAAKPAQQIASVTASAIGAFWLGWFVLGAVNVGGMRPPAGIGLDSPVWATIFIVIPAITCLVGGIRTSLGSNAWYMPIFCILGFYALVLAATRGWPGSILYVVLCVCLVLPTDAWRLRAPRRGGGDRPPQATAIPAWTFAPLGVAVLGIALVALDALR